MPRVDRETSPAAPADRYEFVAGSSVMIVAPQPPPHGGMSTQAQSVASHLREEGVRVRLVATNDSSPLVERVIRPVPIIRTFARECVFLSRLVRGVSDRTVVHVFACSSLYFVLHVLPAVVLARASGRRVVVNYHGGEAASFFRGVGGLLIRVLRAADVVSVPGAYLHHVFAELGIETHVVPNVIDANRFRYRIRDGLKVTKYICTRNLEALYDVGTVIRGFALLRQRTPSATLTLIGSGAQRRELEGLVESLGLAEAVQFAGAVPPAEVPAYLDDCDVFLNASRVDNYPLSIIEAFAAGLPVVTSSAGGIPHIVREESNGLLFPVGDAQALANCMGRLSEDRALRVRLAQEGKRTADAHTWDRVWPSLREVYGIV